MTERWTHAIRRPGPTPDRCMASVGQVEGPIGACGCDVPLRAFDLDVVVALVVEVCSTCTHELVAAFSGRPSDSPEPPR